MIAIVEELLNQHSHYLRIREWSHFSNHIWTLFGLSAPYFRTGFFLEVPIWKGLGQEFLSFLFIFSLSQSNPNRIWSSYICRATYKFCLLLRGFLRIQMFVATARASWRAGRAVTWVSITCAIEELLGLLRRVERVKDDAAFWTAG